MAAKKEPKKKKTTLVWAPKMKLDKVYVDNPYFSRAHDGEGTNPVKIQAVRNIKESAIITLAARKHIDEAQLAAANKFRSLWEAMGGAGAGSFDYSREHVDGGGAPEPLTERQIRAGQELHRCRQTLGVRAYDIMVKVAGEGHAVQELAKTHRERTTLTDYLKDGLDEMAKNWGFQNRGKKRKSA